MGVMINQNQPVWFMSGALGFTWLAAASLVLVPIAVRKERLRLINYLSIRAGQPTPGWAQAVEKSRRLAEADVDVSSAQFLLVTSILGLFFIGCYTANTVMSFKNAAASSSALTQRIAHEIWRGQPGISYFVLVLQSLTILTHVLDAAYAIYVLQTTPKYKELLV